MSEEITIQLHLLVAGIFFGIVGNIMADSLMKILELSKVPRWGFILIYISSIIALGIVAVVLLF